jgi:hypothetical protein
VRIPICHPWEFISNRAIGSSMVRRSSIRRPLCHHFCNSGLLNSAFFLFYGSERIHSWAGSLWKCQTRFGPAMTLK